MDIYNLVSFAGMAAVATNFMAFYFFGLKEQSPTIAVLAAATLTCLMTPCVAGTFFTEDRASILFGD